MSILSVKNVSKKYILAKSKGMLMANLLGFDVGESDEYQALKDIEFSLSKGETLGIIGRNGSGKSTLLKIIAGIVRPSSGTVAVAGRLQALIELGAGFNPELSGVENIRFYCSVLGMTSSEIRDKYDDIVSFADIGRFISEPVKTYSSGMKSRLAFSVAIHSTPEILIVDEVLSVGDIYFRQKCMDRIREMLANGLTLIYVSHNISEVKALCDKAIYLRGGKQVAYGSVDDVCNLYQVGQEDSVQKDRGAREWPMMPVYAEDSRLCFVPVDCENVVRTGNFSNRSGSGEVVFTGVELADSSGERLDRLLSGTTSTIRIDVLAIEAVPPGSAFGVLIRNHLGQDVFAINSDHVGLFLPDMDKGVRYRFEIAVFFPLVEGAYSLSCGIKPDPENNFFYDRCFNALMFEVDRPAYQKKTGGIFYHRAKKIKLMKVGDV